MAFFSCKSLIISILGLENKEAGAQWVCALKLCRLDLLFM